MKSSIANASKRGTAWLDREAYPFKSRWFDHPNGTMHYIDEGEGEVLLFVHGNPSWSFEYRHLIGHFSATHRCIAIDHLGFGLSDHPRNGSYLPQSHAANLARFVQALDLQNVILVVQDWGGPIAISAMLNMPESVQGIVASNSWFFDVRDRKVLKWFSRIVGSPIGRLLCKRANLFPRVLLKASFAKPERLEPDVHRHYLEPFTTAASRKGTWVFPRAITGESEWLASLWARRAAVTAKPALLAWGMKDDAFAPLLAQWEEAFDDHETVTFEDVGHNVAEEAGNRLVEPLSAFLKSLDR